MMKIILISFASFSNSQKISKEGEMCGGMLSDPHQCVNGLECVNTRGPMIADAPGVCHPKCETFRDSWGECVPKNCDIWNNGCNVCKIKDNKLTECSENKCMEKKHQGKCDSYSTSKPIKDTFAECNNLYDLISRMNKVCCANEGGECKTSFPQRCSAECSSIVNVVFKDCKELTKHIGLDKESGWVDFMDKCKKHDTNDIDIKIPEKCSTWYDGCNTCSIRDGKINMCTMRMCIRKGNPYCKQYHRANEQHHEQGRQCFDGKDNDGDGKSDCDDSDCRLYGRCRHKGGSEHGRMCFDGKDNDHDGKSDCDDSDCQKDPRSARRCRRTETGAECRDGRDNDHDGKVDCADPDCKKDPLNKGKCNNH